MSTRVSANARINAACRELVNQRLHISLGQTFDLRQLGAILGVGPIELPELQSLARTPGLGSVLGTLAPASFARAQQALNLPSAALPQAGMDLGALTAAAATEFAAAVHTASSIVDSATRDLTVEAFTEAAAELGYTQSAWRGTTVTGLELRREHELLLLRIHDGGFIESDHAGLADFACGDRQLELEAQVARRGITFSDRKQYNHGAYKGGDLILSASGRRDPSLARATVADYEQRLPAAGAKRYSGELGEQSHRTRELRRGGAR
jgi:hypothetical protein